MPIYSNLYSNLARQGLAKTFTQGYAQSVVAATHPSTYQSQQQRLSLQRRPGRLNNLSVHPQKSFHSSSSSAANSFQDARADKHIHGGLDAYFEAWKKQQVTKEQDPEEEWKQYQFAKRIGWEPPVADADAAVEAAIKTAADEGGVAVEDVLDVSPTTINRSLSSNDLDGLKKLQDETEELQVDFQEDLRAQIKAVHEKALLETGLAQVSRSVTPSISIDGVSVVGEPAEVEAVAPVGQSQTYAEHLTKLAGARRYAEIPAVFEAMLVAGIQPTATAYNALIDAAINIPAEKTQKVPKTLEVYADMLRRKVTPNSKTYDIIISLIASRSREITLSKEMLEDKRIRFGGMDEAGKFMFASHELEHEILVEDDRLDLALRLFNTAITAKQDNFPSETYTELITACASTARVSEMAHVYRHMETRGVLPMTDIFPAMMKGFSASGNLNQAVDCYNEYKELAIAHDNGKISIKNRQDALVYAAVVRAYIVSDKLDGASKFFEKVTESYGENAPVVKNAMISEGFVSGLLERGMISNALTWADVLEPSHKTSVMDRIATFAADRDDRVSALAAYSHLPADYDGLATPTSALLALSIRLGDVSHARHFWRVLSASTMDVSANFIEPAAMYAVALIGSGQVAEGMMEALQMFDRIKATTPLEQQPVIADQIDEGLAFISKFMSSRGISAQQAIAELPVFDQPYPSGYLAQPTPGLEAPFHPIAYQPTAPAFEDSFDPYAASTDFKGSSLIAEELERGMSGRHRGSRLNDALSRFRNIRRAGRHPRYVTYAKLISAAAREEKMELVNEILSMARSDIPLLTQYPVVRYGWVSILDAMVGACLTMGKRGLAGKYHQELLDMGATPTANTYGLYITTLKESTKTFDEASEAVKIFHRAKSEGVEPSSFLYNALIGKLGKARRIDDCLFYFGEMRALGIRPTSVTYGTVVNALCRVSDEKFAEELFDEMESMPNYKPRPAPYNSLMQFFLTTKRDKSKVLAYYERMKSKGIEPTNHTYKLLVDTHATLEPVNMPAAEAVLDVIRSTGQKPEAVHYSSLIHAKGCVLHDMDGARAVFDSVIADPAIAPQACLYQALFESMAANHCVTETQPVLEDMRARRVEMTPYIANTLIHGWANEKQIEQSKQIYASLGREKREPSTYEAMTRAYLAVEDRVSAQAVVQEMCTRGYPNAVTNKVIELVGGGAQASA